MRVFALLTLLTGCIHHPVERLEAMAVRYDRQLAREIRRRPTDDLYWVQPAEALHLALGVLPTYAPVAEVDARAAGTDWVYTSTTGIDDAGEWYTQRRTRLTATVEGTGEAQVVLEEVAEERTFHPTGAPSAWSSTTQPWSQVSLGDDLTALETEHLAHPVLRGSWDALEALAGPALPEGFTMVVGEPGVLTAEQITAETREGYEGDLYATWSRRQRVSLTRQGEGGVLVVTSTEANRFDTEVGEGSWEPASTVDPEPAADWVKAMLGAEHSVVVLGPSTEPAPAHLALTLTEPPRPPPLRTMSAIKEIITQRAVEKATGDFEVCVVGVAVNPVNAQGLTWDLGAVDAVLTGVQIGGAVVSSLGTAASRTINDVADQFDSVGLGDGFRASATEAEVSAQMLTVVGALLAGVAGFTRSVLPTSPDTYGKVSTSFEELSLPLRDDSLSVQYQDECFVKRYRGGAPAVTISLYDQDITEGGQDLIGSCSIPLRSIIDHGEAGVPCGLARVFLAWGYRFSKGQIELVGLPPVEEAGMAP